MAKDAFRTLATAAAAAVTFAASSANAQTTPDPSALGRAQAQETIKRMNEFRAKNGRMPTPAEFAALNGQPAAPSCGSATPGAGRTPQEIMAAMAEARKIKDPDAQLEALRKIGDPAAQKCAQAAVASGPVADIAYSSFTQWVNGMPAGDAAACKSASDTWIKMSGLYTDAQNSPAATAARSALTSKCGPK
jgi:hypothetical protein